MERRTFLQGLGLGVAGLYANPLVAGSVNIAPLAVQLYTIRDAVAKDLEGSLSKLAGIGYKRIELFDYKGTFLVKQQRNLRVFWIAPDYK